ncbi:hypothetical protein HCY54_01495 [Acinetobacter radioresistens]|uniref:DUF4303 domain-containing protein n=2 Tax=Moraxellaceae TaxID=468 RepID=A0ABP2GNI1_ACIRA|nr:hypothetical protein ACIRA0001_1069 [Acinetobacter radioresistens SK82]EEY88030.1 hypothetical protein HMPREF0018_00777 [Acinetobacter radioresistens SH164]EXB87129.1 hypothetical protein J538_0870 [Acinetobacter sp. 272263]EXE57708.1 hypothetical protein J579_1655 [Acinetobacter sp. 1239920]MBA5697980.1 hypothetical protein [Acinetobacter radioresistens]
MAVEKIMSIQDFAFKLSKKIQEQHSVKISRSHIYELIALDQGYKTYNAFVSQNLIIQVQYDDSEEYYQNELINALSLEIFKNPPESDYSNYDEDDLHWDDYEGRHLLDQIKNLITRLQSLSKLDIPEEIHFSIAKTVYQELLYLNIEVINFRVMRESLSHVCFDDGLLNTFELGYESDYGYFEDEEFEFNTIGEHFEAILSYAKDRKNLDAYALVAGYYRYLANQIAPYGRSGSNFGSRWDNDKQKYIKSKETTKNEEKYDEYIKQAELYESYIKNCPLSLAEINFDADEDEVYQQMLYLCNQGDTEAIEYFLYQRLFKNTGEAWLYIYLAQLFDVDFTQDDYRAINAYTGEEYDDYGPMDIVGREAIQHAIDLPDLSEAQDELARKIANELFEKI